ncbi:hypothetical protein OYC64_008178 [Pagothenia borchgrevinki]|uniref:Uncharacterized protein n=1 Tax=Pagothenia borchgrevinki TaxID=8213 RepID=A0ABD2GUK9_PAGBO
MEEKDLVRYLKPIQCRKMMNGIKEGFVTINMEVLPPHPIASSSPTSSSANTLASPQAFRPPHNLLSSPPKHFKLLTVFTTWDAMACRLSCQLEPDANSHSTCSGKRRKTNAR